MAVYRSDSDLTFLKHCNNEDLELLVSILCVDPKDQQPRFAEELTSCALYKKYHPNHNQYWESIAAELQTYGANTIATKLFRQGRGVLYREILIDVCKKKKIEFNKNSPIEVIEMNLLYKIFEDSLNEMTKEQLDQISKDLQINSSNPTPQLILMSLQSSIKLSGFVAYTFATTTLAILLRQLGMKAPFVVYTSLTTTMSIFAGPIGWAITASWLASDIASPAFRVTIPACVIVAYMRQKHLNKEIISQHETQLQKI